MATPESKFAEGMTLMRNGEKAVAKTLLRWKPDWETAAAEFSKAATAFKNAKAWEQAKEAFMRASEAHYNSQSLFSAATALEGAAQMAKELQRYEEAGDLYERAARIFMENGQGDNAASTLSRGALLLAPVNAERALGVYETAIEHYETEGRESFGMDTFKAAVTLSLKSKQYKKSVELLDKVGKVYIKLDNKPALWKIVLSLVVVQLAREDEVAAKLKIDETIEKVPGFLGTEECTIAQQLVETYQSGDQDALIKLTQKQLFNFLEAEVTRLARQLRVPAADDSVM